MTSETEINPFGEGKNSIARRITREKIQMAKSGEKDKARENKHRYLKEMKSLVSDRDFSDYCLYLNLKPDELIGKKVLDLGSGKREIFSKEAAKNGIEVISVSPALKKWFNRKRLCGIIKKNTDWQRRSLAAVAR